jgi:hypothetical protein
MREEAESINVERERNRAGCQEHQDDRRAQQVQPRRSELEAGRQRDEPARDDDRSVFDVVAGARAQKDALDGVARGRRTLESAHDLGRLDAVVDAVGAQHELVAAQELDVGDARLQLALRAERPPKQPAHARLGGSRHLAARDRRVVEHRVVGRQRFRVAQPNEVRACVADVRDEGLVADDQDDRHRRSARDEILVGAALRIDAGIRVVERAEQQRPQVTRRRGAPPEGAAALALP